MSKQCPKKKYCYFCVFTLQIFFCQKCNQKKISFGLQECPDMMKGFLFCCFCVSVMNSKNLHIPHAPDMFCLQKGLSRDSFIYCLKSFSKRSAPWIIDITNLFRSTAKCSSLVVLQYFGLNQSEIKVFELIFLFETLSFTKGLAGNCTRFVQHTALESFSLCARMHLLLLQEL